MPKEDATSKSAPKRILSLDGGGVRGAFTIAYLEQIERCLEEHYGADKAPRLCDYFDLIGGTSTGAIIATALALGYRASQIKDFYFQLGPRVFRSPWFRLWLLQTRFDADALRAELAAVVGDRTLGSEDLQTSLAIVTKRMDTGGTWILTSNPKAKYWDDPEDGSFIGNRHYRLADLVRASTAAPYYFAPHDIEIVAGERPGHFEPLRVVENEVRMGLDLVLAGWTWLEGTVTDEEGHGIPGVEIEAFHVRWGRTSPGRAARTDAAGEFRVGPLPWGRARLEFHHPQYRDAVQGLELVEGDE
ncbi:MAG: patatin-like phospholipase family protein, partial [Pseudomonadota bacterium]